MSQGVARDRARTVQSVTAEDGSESSADYEITHDLLSPKTESNRASESADSREGVTNVAVQLRSPGLQGTDSSLGRPRSDIVQFAVRDYDDSEAGSSTRITITAAANPGEGSDLELAGGVGSTELPMGRFTAFAWSEYGYVGELTTFEVPAPSVVTVPPLQVPRYEFLTTLSPEGLAAPHVEVALTPRAEHPDLAREEIHFTTDADGRALVECQWGPYTITGSHPSLAVESRQIDLKIPSHELETGSLRSQFGDELLVYQPLTFTVKLLNFESLGQAEEFQVATTPDLTPVPFGPDGTVTLDAKLAYHPLPLKLWMPEGLSAFYYLDGGLPENNSTISIDVASDPTLQVALELDATVIERAGTAEMIVAVTYTTQDGHTATAGRTVSGSGTYSIPGLTAGPAIVSFDVNTAEGVVTTCGVEEVLIKESGITPCSLVVDGYAQTVSVLGDESTALRATHVELAPSPSKTAWITGGATDQDGQIQLPRKLPPQLIARADWRDARGREFLAIDHRLESDYVLNTGRIELYPSRETTFGITLSDRSDTQVVVEVSGQVLGATYTTISVSTERDSAPLHLTARSQALATVRGEGLWFRSPSQPIDSDFISFHGYPTCTIEVDSEDRLTSIRHSDFPESLADWVDTSSVVLSTTAQGDLEVTVPCGRYEVNESERESARSLYIEAGGRSRVTR